MATDPQHAFHALIQAWEEFHAAVLDAEDPEAPRVLRAADVLADTYTVYDDLLFTTYGVEAPFDTFLDEDDEEDLDSFDNLDDIDDDDFDSDDGFDSDEDDEEDEDD